MRRHSERDPLEEASTVDGSGAGMGFEGAADATEHHGQGKTRVNPRTVPRCAAIAVWTVMSTTV